MDRYVYVIEYECGEVCYIGAGKGNRLQRHFAGARLGNLDGPLYQYIKDCNARGVVLQAYKVAEELTVTEALNYERALIAWYGRLDIGVGKLFNQTAGGSGVTQQSPSTKAKISTANSRWVRTEEMRQHMREGQMGRIHPESVKAKIRLSNLGTMGRHVNKTSFYPGFTPWNKGKTGVQVDTPETRMKRSKSHIGKKHSAETIAKIRAARQRFEKQKGGEE